MSRRRSFAVAALVLLGLLLPAPASAQAPAPLTATLVFDTPPADLTFSATTPIKINLILANSSGAQIITIPGFSSSEFWRNLYFQLEGVGTITDASASLVHGFVPFGTCHYRGSVILPGAGIQVTAVEVLADNFALQFSFGDARTHFDLSRPGHYSVNARITFYAYSAGAIINDCNIEFGNQSLLSIGEGSTLGRQEFSIVSNSLEFVVLPTDTTPPTTTVQQLPPANGAGWNSQDVTLALSATDNSGGSGVNHIGVVFTGAQTGNQTIMGAGGTVSVTAQGTTTVTFAAVDNQGNAEAPQSRIVKLDKTAPVVTPPASITVIATEPSGARGSASPALAAFLAGGSATDNLATPARLTPQVAGVNVDNSTLFSLGTNTVTFRYQDPAGNTGNATAPVTVVAAGNPAVSVAIAGSGVRQGRVFYYDLRFTNSGTSVAKGVTLQQMTFKTLSGSGNVTYNPGFSPRLPVALGDVAAGASTTLRVYLTVPTAVKKFSMTESGQLKNSAGGTLTFSSTQTVTP